MLAAGFELIDGVWEAGGEGEHRDEIDVDCRGEWEFDSKFPEVPAEFLRGELWQPKVARGFIHCDDILALEGVAVNFLVS